MSIGSWIFLWGFNILSVGGATMEDEPPFEESLAFTTFFWDLSDLLKVHTDDQWQNYINARPNERSILFDTAIKRFSADTYLSSVSASCVRAISHPAGGEFPFKRKAYSYLLYITAYYLLSPAAGSEVPQEDGNPSEKRLIATRLLAFAADPSQLIVKAVNGGEIESESQEITSAEGIFDWTISLPSEDVDMDSWTANFPVEIFASGRQKKRIPMLTKWMVILFGMNTASPECDVKKVFYNARMNQLTAQRANMMVCFLHKTKLPKIKQNYKAIMDWLGNGAPQDKTEKSKSGLKFQECDRLSPNIINGQFMPDHV